MSLNNLQKNTGTKNLFALPKPGQVKGASTQRGIGPAAQPFGPKLVAGPTLPKGQVLGASTGGSSSGGFNSILSDVQKSGVLQKAEKGISNSDIDSIYKPQIDFLNQYSTTLSGQLPGQYADLEAQKATAQNSLNTQGEAQKAGLQSQGQAASAGTEQAVAEQRRQYAELQRGLQAQFGGTTGTGGFAAEIAGQGAMGNIAQIRTGHQQTMRQIADAENALNNDIKDKVFQLDQQLAQAKNEARRNLDDRLAEISGKRSELEGAKRQQKVQALQDYKMLTAEIEARNKQFVQGLYQQYQNTAGQLSQMKNNVTDQNLKAYQDAIAATENNQLDTSGTPAPVAPPSNLLQLPSSVNEEGQSPFTETLDSLFN